MSTPITAATIAKEAGTSIYKAQYYLRTRQIRPVARVGVVRVFSTKEARIAIRDLKQADVRRTNK